MFSHEDNQGHKELEPEWLLLLLYKHNSEGRQNISLWPWLSSWENQLAGAQSLLVLTPGTISFPLCLSLAVI